MGTRGYRVTRFRGRYYRFYNHWDSYPEGLGKDIAKTIPADPKAYQEWLAKRRQEALEWHNALERFLCKKKAEDLDVITPKIQNVEIEDRYATNIQPWGVGTDVLPNFTPAFNDLHIEWVYTIDLDNEVFTIDNGAHLHLIHASDLTWIDALAHGFWGDKFLLPGTMPEEAIACIVARPPKPSRKILDTYTKLNVEMVQPKGLKGFSPSHRHGPLFRSRIYGFFMEIYGPMMAAALLSWTPEDWIFREFAYAVLSLASADLYPSILPNSQVLQHGRIACAAFKDEGEESDTYELFSHLGAGSHLEGVLPGSSPASGTYWFESVLVHLVTQLLDWPVLVDAAVVFVVKYCRKERPNQRVDVILMSIEYVVLMTIHPDGRVEQTEPLRLFDIKLHTTLEPQHRYEKWELDEMLGLKKKACERREIREGRYRKKSLIAQGKPIEEGLKDIALESDEEEGVGPDEIEEQTSWPAGGMRGPRMAKVEQAFHALGFFLESASRRQLPPSPTREGVFPTELYHAILLHVADVKTHRACMQVSTKFRDICQQELLMMDGYRFLATEASKTDDATSTTVSAFRMQNMATESSADVALTRLGDLTGYMGGFGKRRAPEVIWRFVIGREFNRRSLVPNLILGIDKVE